MSPNHVQSTESLSAEGKFLRASRNDALAKKGFHPHVDGTTVEKKGQRSRRFLSSPGGPEEQTSSGLHS